MKKKKRQKKPSSCYGISYDALKGMSYAPSVRDKNRKDRKQAKQDLKKESE